VRATSEGPDEIGTLVVTFNEMLDQIARQNSDLEEARADLERRVEARTHDLAAANKELEAFSYSVSHDLRAPLRGIDGFSNALLSRYGPQLDEQGRHYLERVRAATQRMSQLIDDLLGLARVSRRELVRKRADLSEIACQVGAELSRRQPTRQVRVDVQPALTAQADPHLLTIVLENLMGNAWKFTGKTADAHVEVGRRADGPDPAFYVRDNGAGFDMAYADKLFGAFQRLHAEADFEGTGIGLATVQRIVTRHGGRIWAEGGGQGSDVLLHYGAQSMNDNRPILLVEDNRDDVELTVMALKEAKITNPVVVAGNGVEALDYLFGTGTHAGRDASNQPVVVLLDIKLPLLNGIDVLRRMREDERTRRTPVVMLTSSDERQDIAATYDLGANSYVRKPVEFEGFLSAARQLGLYWTVLNEPPAPATGR